MNQQQGSNPAELYEQYFVNPDILAVVRPLSCAGERYLSDRDRACEGYFSKPSRSGRAGRG